VESPGCNGRGLNVELQARGISADHALEGGTVYAAKAVAARVNEPMISYSRGAFASNIRT
jgi:hypothetical protein